MSQYDADHSAARPIEDVSRHSAPAVSPVVDLMPYLAGAPSGSPPGARARRSLIVGVLVLAVAGLGSAAFLQSDGSASEGPVASDPSVATHAPGLTRDTAHAHRRSPIRRVSASAF
jgi:hypothetical protein